VDLVVGGGNGTPAGGDGGDGGPIGLLGGHAHVGVFSVHHTGLHHRRALADASPQADGTTPD